MEPQQLEGLLNKVGGKFKLVTLFQKRMRELQRGLPKLVSSETNSLWDIVATEIMDSKVDLIMGAEAEQMRKELAVRESEEAPAKEAPKAGKAAEGEAKA